MLRLTRSLRRRLAGLMVLVLLAIQMATAAYACPTAVAAPASDKAVAMAGMPGCTQSTETPCGMVDPRQPGLCLAHCNADNVASSDQGSGTLQLPPPVPALYIAMALFVVVPLRGRRLPHAPKTERATPLPLSVLHCCYRV
jgi:hypothetical protein